MLVLIQLLLIVSFILIAGMPVVLVSLAFMHLRTRRYRREILIAFAFVAGGLIGGVLTWHAVPSGWALPFWTTLAATVDAEKYGHTIEHAAEQIMTMVTFACVLAGVVSAVAAATGPRIVARLRHG